MVEKILLNNCLIGGIRINRIIDLLLEVHTHIDLLLTNSHVFPNASFFFFFNHFIYNTKCF